MNDFNFCINNNSSASRSSGFCSNNLCGIYTSENWGLNKRLAWEVKEEMK